MNVVLCISDASAGKDRQVGPGIPGANPMQKDSVDEPGTLEAGHERAAWLRGPV